MIKKEFDIKWIQSGVESMSLDNNLGTSKHTLTFLQHHHLSFIHSNLINILLNKSN